jgi:hypothetical protein
MMPIEALVPDGATVFTIFRDFRSTMCMYL